MQYCSRQQWNGCTFAEAENVLFTTKGRKPDIAYNIVIRTRSLATTPDNTYNNKSHWQTIQSATQQQVTTLAAKDASCQRLSIHVTTTQQRTARVTTIQKDTHLLCQDHRSCTKIQKIFLKDAFLNKRFNSWHSTEVAILNALQNQQGSTERPSKRACG